MGSANCSGQRSHNRSSAQQNGRNQQPSNGNNMNQQQNVAEQVQARSNQQPQQRQEQPNNIPGPQINREQQEQQLQSAQNNNQVFSSFQQFQEEQSMQWQNFSQAQGQPNSGQSQIQNANFNLSMNKVHVMNSEVAIRQKSIKIEAETNSIYNTKIKLKFKYDILKPVQIAVYLFVYEKKLFFYELTQKLVQYKHKEVLEDKTLAQNKQFVSQLDFKFDEYKPEELKYDKNYYQASNQQLDYWPLIIRLEKLAPTEPRFVMLYYGSFQKEGEEYRIKIHKHKLEYNNQAYEVQDIYGIENSDLVSKNVLQQENTQQSQNQGEEEHQKELANMDDTNKDCIICLCEKIDTVILPCRHMCVCMECAKSIQQKQQRNKKTCPICRKVIESFLRITKR